MDGDQPPSPGGGRGVGPARRARRRRPARAFAQEAVPLVPELAAADGVAHLGVSGLVAEATWRLPLRFTMTQPASVLNGAEV